MKRALETQGVGERQSRQYSRDTKTQGQIPSE